MYIRNICLIIMLLTCVVGGNAQSWQWLRRMGQPLDASGLGASGSYPIYADGPKNLEMDKDGDLIMTAAVGRYPDTCHNPLLGGCSVDSAASRPFNALIARYDCSGRQLWRQYIGFRTTNTQLYYYGYDLQVTPNIILSKDKSEIIIIDQVNAGDTTHPMSYSIGDTLINLPNDDRVFTNIYARLDLNGHLKFFKESGSRGISTFGSGVRDAPNTVCAASGGDIIGLTAFEAFNLVQPSDPPFIKIWDEDSVRASVDSVYRGIIPEYRFYAFRADSVGRIKWATAIACYVGDIYNMFIDDHDNVTLEIGIELRPNIDSAIVGNVLIQDTSLLRSPHYDIYRCITKIDGNGHLGNTLVPPYSHSSVDPIVSIKLEHTDREGNSYILAIGKSYIDTILGIPFNLSLYPYGYLGDSMTKMLIKLDTNLNPIWHYTTNDSSKVIRMIPHGYSSSFMETYPKFGELPLGGHYAEDKDGHIYMPIMLGPDTFYYHGQRLTAPIPNTPDCVNGRQGFAIVDKTTGSIVDYHLLDNQLHFVQGAYDGGNYAFSYPVVDEQGNYYSANFLNGFQIAGHDTVTAYAGGSDQVDIGMCKWGLGCRRDTSLLSPLGHGDSLRADGVSASQILVRWIDSATYETGYRVYRSPDGQTGWQLIDSVGPNITTYTNGGLPQATVYYYRVAPVNGLVQGASYSNIDSGQTWISTDILQTQGNAQVTIHPNPATSVVTVECTTDRADDVQVEIWDAMGQRMYSQHMYLQEGYQQQTVDVYSYAPGSYYLSMSGQYTSVHTAITIVR